MKGLCGTVRPSPRTTEGFSGSLVCVQQVFPRPKWVLVCFHSCSGRQVGLALRVAAFKEITQRRTRSKRNQGSARDGTRGGGTFGVAQVAVGASTEGSGGLRIRAGRATKRGRGENWLRE